MTKLVFTADDFGFPKYSVHIASVANAKLEAYLKEHGKVV